MKWTKYTEYIIFDDPISYQRQEDNEPLLIYPIRMRDLARFGAFSECLLVDKNSIPDAKIISMGYLEYMYYATIIDSEKTPYILMFRELMKICFNKRTQEEANFDFNKSFERPFFFKVGENTYFEQDFMEIRRIIAEQNMLDLPEDSEFDKATRDALEEARKQKAEMNNEKMCSLEDQMVALSISTGMKLEDIYEMTYRKFSKALERIDHKLSYELATMLLPYRDPADKSKIKHWLADLTKNKYEDVLVNMSDLKKKIDMVNGN